MKYAVALIGLVLLTLSTWPWLGKQTPIKDNPCYTPVKEKVKETIPKKRKKAYLPEEPVVADVETTFTKKNPYFERELIGFSIEETEDATGHEVVLATFGPYDKELALEEFEYWNDNKQEGYSYSLGESWTNPPWTDD